MSDTVRVPDSYKASAIAEVAYFAFVKAERLKFQLEKAEVEATAANFQLGNKGSEEDRLWYYRITTEVIQQFEEKRRKAKL